MSLTTCSIHELKLRFTHNTQLYAIHSCVWIFSIVCCNCHTQRHTSRKRFVSTEHTLHLYACIQVLCVVMQSIEHTHNELCHVCCYQYSIAITKKICAQLFLRLSSNKLIREHLVVVLKWNSCHVIRRSPFTEILWNNHLIKSQDEFF